MSRVLYTVNDELIAVQLSLKARLSYVCRPKDNNYYPKTNFMIQFLDVDQLSQIWSEITCHSKALMNTIKQLDTN